MEILKTPKFQWVNIKTLYKKELDEISRKYRIQKGDLEECLPPLQRSKVIERRDYTFFLFVFPRYNNQTKSIDFSELGIFIRGNTLITTQTSKHHEVDTYFKAASKKYHVLSISEIVSTILRRLTRPVFPMLDQIAINLDELEKEVYDIKNKDVIKRILDFKTDLIDFKKAIQNHRYIIERMEKRLPKNGNKKTSEEFSLVRDNIDTIWDLLDNEMQTINTLHASHESYVNFHTNTVVKSLTMVSAIVLPLVLLAGIFGMNVEYAPFLGEPLDFWIIMIIMLFGSLSIFFIFKIKRW